MAGMWSSSLIFSLLPLFSAGISRNRNSCRVTRCLSRRMISPPGWHEPGQRPVFDEYTVVLKGRLQVESEDGTLDIRAGEAVITYAGEWVRYSTPEPEGAEYIAVCLPAFSPDTVHRDDEMA